jgi:hypothetical protein
MTMQTTTTGYGLDPAGILAGAPASSCCSPAEQEACCEPSAKASCCGAEPGCGCR